VRPAIVPNEDHPDIEESQGNGSGRSKKRKNCRASQQADKFYEPRPEIRPSGEELERA